MGAVDLLAGYAGGAFHPSLENGRAAGRLRLAGDALVFEAGPARVELPLIGLQVTRGGAAKRLIFFAHAERPGWALFTADRAILRDPRLKMYPELEKQIMKIHGHRVAGWLAAAAVLAALAGGAYGLYLAKDPLASAVVRQIPSAWEEKLGDAAFQQYRLQVRFVEDPQTQKEFEELARPLLAAVPGQPWAFKLHIAKDGTLNAFALPGGHVVVNTGLLLAADRPEEVLAVLAHEIAHVTRRHALQQMVQALGLFALVQAFFGDVSGVLAVLADNGAMLLTHKFSRDHEREADETGWAYLLQARVDPRGMITLFGKLKAEQEKLGAGALDGALGYLSTHPDTAERIARLEALAAQQPASEQTVPPPLDYARFRDRLRAAQ